MPIYQELHIAELLTIFVFFPMLELIAGFSYCAHLLIYLLARWFAAVMLMPSGNVERAIHTI